MGRFIFVEEYVKIKEVQLANASNITVLIDIYLFKWVLKIHKWSIVNLDVWISFESFLCELNILKAIKFVMDDEEKHK